MIALAAGAQENRAERGVILKKKLKPDGPVNGFEYEKNKDGNLINL